MKTLRTSLNRLVGRGAQLALVGALAAAALTVAPKPTEAATLPALRIDDVQVTEGNSGTKSISVTLRLDRPAPADKLVYVRVGTADGTAKGANCGACTGDYGPTNVLNVFPPGTTTRTVFVTILGDTAREANETFFLKVLTIENATVADGTGVITILNDD